MAGWRRPIFKRLVESELGRGNTAGPVIGREREYFQLDPGETRPIRIHLVVDGIPQSQFDANANYYASETHNHVHVTGNILGELREVGAEAGDYLVIWGSDDPGVYLFELVRPGSERHQALTEVLPPGDFATGPVSFAPYEEAPDAPAPALETAAAEAALSVLEVRERSADSDFSGQGFESNAERRQAIDVHAMSVARGYFEREGYDVDDVSGTESFDLLCRRGERELHVEVKGTTGDGGTVTVTRGEVEHARVSGDEYESQLCVVSRIDIDDYGEHEPQAGGGDLEIFPSWQPEDARLTPISFTYRTPRDSEDARPDPA